MPDDPIPEDGQTMSGQPASPGRYEGTAHVIMDPSLYIDLKPGEVLVAPFTDPAWTPLFLTAGAAVVEDRRRTIRARRYHLTPVIRQAYTPHITYGI